jgi:hypothetical protein
MTDSTKVIAFCPHCGNRASQRLVHTQNYQGRWFVVSTGEEDTSGMTSTYYVAVCETCGEVLLYNDAVGEHTPETFNNAELRWPLSGLHKSVPKVVADCYLEAERIKNIAPNAFAVQIRRALETICDDRKAKKGVLQKRLKELVDRGEIPATLAEMSETLRVLGNLGAHSSDEGVKAMQVFAINDFFRAVVEYVYVAPSKLSDFHERLVKKKEKKTKPLE